MILEENPDNLNAFGLVHAGAICGLAETAGGMAIFNYLDPMEFLVLNTVLNIRFVAMPRANCAAACGWLPRRSKRCSPTFRFSAGRQGREPQGAGFLGQDGGRRPGELSADGDPDEFKKYFEGMAS